MKQHKEQQNNFKSIICYVTRETSKYAILFELISYVPWSTTFLNFFTDGDIFMKIYVKELCLGSF